MTASLCLKKARKKLCMTQVEFARFLKISTASVTNYEMGITIPRPSTARKIVDRLKEKLIKISYSSLME